MNIIAKFENLSGKEKLAVIAVLGIAGYVVYDQFAPKKALAATNAPPAAALPQARPAAVPVNVNAGTASYKIITQTDPLYVRSGPGQNYDVVGSNPPGTIVRATSEMRTGMVEGAMGQWAAILKPDGTPWGWSAMKYLQPVGVATPANV